MIKRALKALFFAFPPRFFVVSGKTRQKTLYLTFDDGPTAGVTDQLIKLLAAFNVDATFFIVGDKLEENINLGQALVTAKHTVANHSLDHKGFGQLQLAEQLAQVNDAETVINKLPVKSPRLFRAPQGRWSIKLIFALYRSGYRCVHWSYDSMDYEKWTADTIIQQFKRTPVKNDDIILFHDDSEKCIQVLQEMLPVWKQQGFQFKTIDSI